MLDWTLPPAQRTGANVLLADTCHPDRLVDVQAIAPLIGLSPQRTVHIRLAYSELPIEQLNEGVQRLARAIERATASTRDVDGSKSARV
jgi:hypothetical protein